MSVAHTTLCPQCSVGDRGHSVAGSPVNARQKRGVPWGCAEAPAHVSSSQRRTSASRSLVENGLATAALAPRANPLLTSTSRPLGASIMIATAPASGRAAPAAGNQDSVCPTAPRPGAPGPAQSGPASPLPRFPCGRYPPGSRPAAGETRPKTECWPRRRLSVPSPPCPPRSVSHLQEVPTSRSTHLQSPHLQEVPPPPGSTPTSRKYPHLQEVPLPRARTADAGPVSSAGLLSCCASRSVF